MKVRCLIPCAGSGTRMQMPIDKSKELLINPLTDKTLLDFHIELCKEYQLDPLIITRKEKIDLIAYCNDNNIEYLIIEPKGEWTTTLLASSDLWHEDNILLLPDTVFSSTEAIGMIISHLSSEAKSAWALHYVKDGNKWGMLDNYNKIIEKPKHIDKGLAWGIIGFKKDEGKKIFTDLMEKGEYTLEEAGLVHLESFKDLTRGDKT